MQEVIGSTPIFSTIQGEVEYKVLPFYFFAFSPLEEIFDILTHKTVSKDLKEVKLK